MQVFEVTETKSAKKVENFKTVSEAIENADDKVLLIVDNEKRDIWLYKGKSSKIVTQFIGCELQKDMKMQLRGFYKTRDFHSITKDAMRERILDGKIKDGRAEEIINEVKDEVIEKDELKKASELLDQSRMKETCVHKGLTVTSALKEVENLDNPEGFHRHMTMIGGSVYTEKDIVEHFMIGEEVNKKLTKIGTIPNGFFFVPGMSTRIMIERRKVLCLDLLVENNAKFGDKNIRVPLFFKEQLHRDGDMQVLLKSFRKPTEDKEATSDSI